LSLRDHEVAWPPLRRS